VIAKFEKTEEAQLIASWLFSVFGQIQMEYSSIAQEGLRKLEKAQVGNLVVPDFSKISSEDKKLLIDTFIDDEPLNFSLLAQRPIDEAWTRILSKYFGIEISLKEFFNLLGDLVDERSP
jgi:hypothetical protein